MSDLRWPWAHPRNSDWTEGREVAHRQASGLARMQAARERHKVSYKESRDGLD